MLKCKSCIYIDECGIDKKSICYIALETEECDSEINNLIEENRENFRKEFFEYIDAFYFD